MSHKPIPNGSTENEQSDRQNRERVKTVVPPDQSPATHCPYCGRPFGTEQLCALHLGEHHRTEWTDDERECYENAYDTETDELFILHLKVVGALVLTFFAFSYAYMFVWS